MIELIGLYSGRDIVARKANGEILTRTQTAASAYNAITKKYGDIIASAKYFHRGKGNWVRYSITNDRKRTGKTTNDIKKWRASPHKLDYEGKDTADTRSCGKSLSTAAQLHNPFNLPIRRISLNIPESSRESARGRDKLYHSIRAHGIIDEIDNKAFLDRLTSKQLQYIIENYTQYQKPFPENPRFVYTVSEPRFKASQMVTPKAQLKKRDSKKPIVCKRSAITKHMPKPIKTKTVKTKYIYGSFQRPIWNGFDPGVKYKLLSNITDAYRDPRWNRKPHDVIITESPISAEKQYALQLTDIAQGKKMNAMIKRVNAIKSLDDNMKGSLISQILKGVDPAVINKYIEKGKAAGKRGAKRVNRDKLSVAERAPDVKASTGTKPATFDLKNNPNRKEFVSDYTGITDHLQRRAKRVAKIHTDRDKGCHKDADTRRREASHARYKKRADKMRTSYPKKR